MSIYVDIEKKLGAFRLKVKFQCGDETLALLGASGCGKSMTLKCIAGIETPDRGKIVIDDVTVFDSERHINLTPQERRVGLLFQNYALFPNMTVLQNIRTGARREKDRSRRDGMVSQVMERFGLLPLAGHYPHQLSGGQQQRVALARILVSAPRMLLLDEPFSALDSHLRFKLEQEVRSVIRSFGKTVLLVSHDRDEVFRMADRIAVMEHGHIDAAGAKKEVFADPKTRTGAMLTGCKNISQASWVADAMGQDATGEDISRDTGQPGKIYAADWGMTLEVPRCDRAVAYVGIRMHDIQILDVPESKPNVFTCQVVDVMENPFSMTVLVRSVYQPEAHTLGLEFPKETWKEYGEQVNIHIPVEAILLLEEKET